MNTAIKKIGVMALVLTVLTCWIGIAIAADGLVNINTATVKQLKAIPGIGKKTAERIVQYREKNGPFKTKKDIQKVKGIGLKKFEKFKDLITLTDKK
jgi:competence protein ComEA